MIDDSGIGNLFITLAALWESPQFGATPAGLGGECVRVYNEACRADLEDT
jgi:hypothetical protein